MAITAYAYVNNAPDITSQNLSWNAPGASPQSGSGQSFTLSYGNPGTYTLTLNGYGSPVTATVTVMGSPAGGACPTFDFDIQHPAGTSVRERSTPGAGGGGSAGGFSASAGWTLWFTQNLGNPPSRWTWDFGDSTAPETTQAPQHVYTKAGVYTVTLTIPSADGSSQCSKSNTITVTEPSGTAGSCVEDPLTMCLINSRYKVTSNWQNQYAGGALSKLYKTRLTDAIGAFWLSDNSSFEYLIRINTATDNGRAWISIPMLTDVEFWVVVTDTAVNGQVKEYHSLPGNKIPIYDPLSFVYP
jgi:PKD domain